MDNDKQHKGWHSRGYLPHFDEPGRTQAITFRLADSIPQGVLEKIIDKYKNDDKKQRSIISKYLDKGLGRCYLQDSQIASIVEETLLKFDGKRYRLLAWVIMPNHVHAIIDCQEGYPLHKIVHSWKSYTANEANKLLNRKGRFWQPDYFDRYVRNENDLESKIHYVHLNPVNAGLVENPEDWPFSSAKLC